MLRYNIGENNNSKCNTTYASSLGNLRNTVASTTRIFKYCNNDSPDLNITLGCVFNKQEPENINSTFIESHHILNTEKISLEDISNESEAESNISTKSIIRGPFTPNQIKKAYSINNIVPLSGIRRPIVTIIAAFNNPFLQRDIKSFGNVFGLPKCNYTIHNFSRKFSSNWATEVTLNAQWIYATNPHAQIRIILAKSHSTKDMLNAVSFANNKNNFANKRDTDIMSMSWGSADIGNLKFYNNYFSNPNTIYVASSGNSNNVSVPSSCTNILSIGGTSLNINSSFERITETVWNKSGTGFSKTFDKPLHQPTIQNNYNNKRITPDLCCVADPNTPCYIIINNKAYTTGGTSLAAPIYAGMLSVLTQNRLNKKLFTYTSVANRYNSIQPLLYDSNNRDCYFDVTEGTTSINNASTGFDIASGNGVFNLETVLNKIG